MGWEGLLVDHARRLEGKGRARRGVEGPVSPVGEGASEVPRRHALPPSVAFNPFFRGSPVAGPSQPRRSASVKGENQEGPSPASDDQVAADPVAGGGPRTLQDVVEEFMDSQRVSANGSAGKEQESSRSVDQPVSHWCL